ncbi:FAD-binding protein [Nostoc commune]|uniref:FAD-binding protein n=1 Tax=Nostoc commune TaxID=1178 RepID=UPI0018C4F1B5|nr:FAD-binding protein [Nostoc commune]MBG1260337.1 FAD-binding protein [Nostoc commune BAE]
MNQVFTFSDFPWTEGSFSTNSEDISKAGQDFGQIILTHPIGVLKPKEITDICNIVRYAAQNQLKLIPRGMSHSAFGQSQCHGGIVIDMTSFNRILSKDYSSGSAWVNVEAGCTWNKLIKSTIEDRYSPFVTTDWQFITVGGTLSTGGVGFMSYQKGLQTDNVLELDVVTGRGEVKICSLESNQRLFHAVRSGLGQFGIIARAKVKLGYAPSDLKIIQFFHTDSKLYLQDIQRLVDQQYFDCIHSFIIPNQLKAIEERIGQNKTLEYKEVITNLIAQPQQWIYFTELGKCSADYSKSHLEGLNQFANFVLLSQANFFDYLHKDPPLITAEKRQGKLTHPELTLIMPEHNLHEFMSELLLELTYDLMGGGTVLLIPLIRDQLSTPLFQTPATNSLFFVGILRNAPLNETELIDRQTQQNLVIYEKAVNFGGNRYPCDSIPKPGSPSEWAEHFGVDKWQEICELKAEFDPENLFISNLNMFGGALN